MFFPTGDDKESQPATSSCRHFEFHDIVSATHNFDESLAIGHGGFGKVYKGNIMVGSTYVVAAIKRLDTISNQGEAEFWAEVETLSKLRHCNLVSLIGYCNHEKEMILVYEYMSNGTLEDHLHKLGTPLSWLQRLKICIGAGRGLHYLHTGTGIESGVIHRDVKSSNILLHESWAAKISDFGLSKIGPINQPTTYVNTLIKGTFGYLDPDYYATGKLTRKSDVYAFGVVMLEILCRRRALDRSLDEEQMNLARWVQESIKEGNLKHIVDYDIRGEIAQKCLKEFVRIAERCLTINTKQRLTMAQVLVSLENVLILQEKYNNSLQPVCRTLLGRMVNMLPFSSKGVNSVQKPVKIETEGNDGVHQNEICRVFTTLYGVDGAQEAAGWPAWLTVVAGEAIKGWLPRRVDSFEKLDKIGQGTCSILYKARDLETGNIVALKRVRSDITDPESIRFVAREIIVLRRIDHPNVMKLEGLITSRDSGSFYLVFEYIEHDLAGLVASPMIKLTEPQIKCYLQQLLCGLEHCHKRGVLHRDIKGSNLLIDSNGNLKIGDFGSATFYSSDQRQPLTSRVVTLWYRPPELLLGATNYGVAVDLWSAGCILAELFAGKPIMPGRTEVEQLHKIFKLCGSPSEEYWRKRLPHATLFKPQHPYTRCVAETYRDFPPPALALLDSLLAIEPDKRGSSTSALQSEFLTIKPLPCHHSSLPKYPPSKEYDTKMRDDELSRNKVGRGKERAAKPLERGTRKSRTQPELDANAEFLTSIHNQRKKAERTRARGKDLVVGLRKLLEKQNPKSSSEKFNQLEDRGSVFPIEPSSGSLQFNSYNGRSKQSGVQEEADEAQGGQDSSQHHKHRLAQLTKLSNSLPWHGNSWWDNSEGTSAHWPEDRSNGKYHQLNDPESSHHMFDRPDRFYKKHEHAPAIGYAPKKTRIITAKPFDTPLLSPPGGNTRTLDEMLIEHERHIQHAVLMARLRRYQDQKGQCL